MTASITLSGVSKSFPALSLVDELAIATGNISALTDKTAGVLAVDNVTLSVREGDRLGVIGPNGAGKSSLLQLVSGVASPSSGQISVNGRIISILTLGSVLREELTGRENILLDAAIQDIPNDQLDLVIDHVIEFSELGSFIDHPVRTYSTGMKARLAFSMISQLEPEILILDETLAVGDAFFVRKAGQRIKEICDKGKIIILVSHSMDSIRRICNRCILMRDGRIEMDGTPEYVTAAYVQEIKEEDSRRLLSRFKQSVGSNSLVEGYFIAEQELYSGGSDVPTVRVELGACLRILIRATLPESFDRRENLCRVSITRIDDLVMWEEEFIAVDYFDPEENGCLEITFEEFRLSPNVYRLDTELLDASRTEGNCAANFSTVFEVYRTSDNHIGGRAMFDWPVVMEVNSG